MPERRKDDCVTLEAFAVLVNHIRCMSIDGQVGNDWYLRRFEPYVGKALLSCVKDPAMKLPMSRWLIDDNNKINSTTRLTKTEGRCGSPERHTHP